MKPKPQKAWGVYTRLGEIRRGRFSNTLLVSTSRRDAKDDCDERFDDKVYPVLITPEVKRGK